MRQNACVHGRETNNFPNAYTRFPTSDNTWRLEGARTRLNERFRVPEPGSRRVIAFFDQNAGFCSEHYSV